MSPISQPWGHSSPGTKGWLGDTFEQQKHGQRNKKQWTEAQCYDFLDCRAAQKVAVFIGVPLLGEDSVAWQDSEEREKNIRECPLIQECLMPINCTVWQSKHMEGNALLGAHLV